MQPSKVKRTSHKYIVIVGGNAQLESKLLSSTVFCMIAASTASADLSSKIHLLLHCPIGSLAERFCFLRCFSSSSNAIFSGMLVKILVFPDRDGLDVF